MPGITPLAHIHCRNELEPNQSATGPAQRRYVNQFILGPSFAERLTGWQRLEVAGRLKLTAHPALACTKAADGAREVVLIGHILDPHNVDETNDDIVRGLLRCFTSREALIKATERLGGRWLLIASSPGDSFLFHDAMGLRQAFYSELSDTGSLWVVSQPGLAAEVMSLTPDSLALDYMDSQTFRRTSEHRFPGTASTFKEIQHLLPNHWLDLQSGKSQRYWPASPLIRLMPNEAIDRLLLLLSEQIGAAANRFDLALSLTAGLDSRLVLAAARTVVDRLSIVTIRQGRMPDGHADIAIPARLLKRLGLSHEIVRASSSMTPEFSLQFKENVYLAHDHYGHDAEAILQRFSRTKAALTGSAAEVGRTPFRGKLPLADYVKFTPELLAWLEYGSTHPFLVAHFREWLADAGQQKFVKLLDLFEWEQDYGNWLAMTQLEFDVAWREIFTPYNCREVLATMLAVDERYRKPPDFLLFRSAIQKAWPELLIEPINPHTVRGRLSHRWADAKAMIHYWLFKREQRKRGIRP
jgi:hypothetical protein